MRTISIRDVAKWAGLLWIAAVAVSSGVIGAVEAGEGRALIFPAVSGLGEITLLAAIAWPGFLLHGWATRRDT
jgi:hypothetical protein